MAAHGTAMAGIIAAKNNSTGIVGVAPGVRIFSLKIFANDLSASSTSISQAISSTVVNSVDINVHPYSLPYSDTDAQLTSGIENSLRQSFESGRGGLGTTNIAAAGNFYSQVEYPAQSRWCVAVGSTTSAGERIPRSNWGGKGIDFTMPGIALDVGPSIPFSPTGFVTTDLSGASGIAGPNLSLEGNEQGNYAAIGYNEAFGNGFTTATRDVANRYQGTSVSAAMAGGVLALLLSDERYNSFGPFVNVGPVTTRQSRRDRAPRRPNEILTLLALMKNFSDLPGGDPLRYIDGVDEFYGFGRPNPARALALSGGEPQTQSNVTPDYSYRDLLEAAPRYTVTFGLTGLAGDNESETTAPILAQGWEPDANNNITSGDSLISPYLEGVDRLYFEDGSVLEAPPPGDDGLSQFLYVWTDSVTTAPTSSATSTAADNLLYNPEGTYHATGVPFNNSGGKLRINGPDIPTPDIPVPMVLDIQLAHELGVQNSSSDGLSGPAGQTATISEEIDTIKLYARVKIDDTNTIDVELATLTGDSTGRTKNRLAAATVISPSPGVFRPLWPTVPTATYDPKVAEEEMLIRNYSFLIPALTPSTTFKLVVELNPGQSFLPTYVAATGTTPITYSQVNNVFRDHRGFILYSATVTDLRQDYMNYLGQNNYELADGLYPTWSASQHDVLYSRDGTGDSSLLTVDPEKLYVTDPAGSGVSSVGRRPEIPLSKTTNSEVITGLKAHPIQEILAMTTSSPEGEFVYTVTSDGTNQTRIIDPSLTIGARDPGWSINGSQLAYCSDEYLRIASLQDDGNYSIETVLTTTLSTVFLHDFHSPVFDPLSGVLYFTARRRDGAATDTSLKIYVATRTGRVITYKVDPREPMVDNWDNINIFDLDISSSGKRLIFSANASVPPIFDEESEEYSDAVPSSACSIFTIENFDFVVNYNDPPIFTKVLLEDNNPDFETVSARWPRISPDRREFVWAGLDTPANVDTQLPFWRIVRQPLLFEYPGEAINIPDPIGTPTTYPTATPPPTDDAQVTHTGGFNFVADAQGWEFRNAAGTFDVPTTSYLNVDGLPTQIQTGVIGFLVSSANSIEGDGIRVATLNFTPLQNGGTSLSYLSTAPNRTRVLDTLLNELPVTLESGGVTIGTRGGSAARLYFSPSSASATLGTPLTVDVYMDTNGQPVSDVEAYISFNPAVLRYDSGAPNNSEFERTRGLGRITMVSTSNSTFGYAESATASLQVIPNAMYLYRASVSATPGTQASRVPTVRLRVNSTNLESAFTVETNSRGDLSLSPNASAPKNIDLLFRPPADISSLPISKRRYTLAIDLLNFDPTDDPSGGITLHAVDIYRLDDAASKSVVQAPETIFETEFDNQADRALFDVGPFIPEFTPPEFIAYPSSLAMRVLNKTNTFGFWSADGNSIPSGTVTIDPEAPTVIYRATYRLKNEAEADPLRVPDFRLRLATSDFQRSVSGLLISVQDGMTVPTAGKPKTLTLYLVLEEVPADFNAFVAAFDILSFYPGRTITDKPLEIDYLKIERVHVPKYPAPR
jgi:hypothetical protein